MAAKRLVLAGGCLVLAAFALGAVHHEGAPLNGYPLIGTAEAHQAPQAGDTRGRMAAAASPYTGVVVAENTIPVQEEAPARAEGGGPSEASRAGTALAEGTICGLDLSGVLVGPTGVRCDRASADQEGWTILGWPAAIRPDAKALKRLLARPVARRFIGLPVRCSQAPGQPRSCVAGGRDLFEALAAAGRFQSGMK